MASQTLPKFGITLALGAATAALIAAGTSFRATDATVPPAAEAGEISIPSAPPVSEALPMPTDAFTRPMFHANRGPGLDKAPTVAPDDTTQPAGDPDASEPAAADGFVLKGLIIGDRGARVALQSSSGGAPVWAKVGETVEGWKVESITADRVRIRNGDEVAEIKLFEDK
jgi:hypothetical protein